MKTTTGGIQYPDGAVDHVAQAGEQFQVMAESIQHVLDDFPTKVSTIVTDASEKAAAAQNAAETAAQKAVDTVAGAAAAQDGAVAALIANTASATAKAVLAVCAPVILFDDDQAALGNSVTLSQSVENFARITLCFKSADGLYSSMTVPHPQGKKLGLDNQTASSGAKTMYFKSRDVILSGTSVSTSNGREGSYATSAAGYKDEKCIAVTQVLGWRY